MSKIIINKKISTDGNKKFFAIPVRPIKVLLSFSDKPEFNHFERAVLGLLSHQFYSIAELADMLELNQELIELIESNLKKNEYLDENTHVTEKGNKVLRNAHAKTIDKICYVFYDLNRQKVLSAAGDNNDILITQGSDSTFMLKTDAFDEQIIYRTIKVSTARNKLNEQAIVNTVRHDIFASSDKNLVNVKILELDQSTYNFISYLESNIDDKNSYWKVVNPITLEQDEALYDFFYMNSSNDTIGSLIRNVMQFKQNGFNIELNNELYLSIKNKLFNHKIKDIHEHLIYPLMKVIFVLKSAEEVNYNDKIKRIESIKTAMVELGDLFEKVLYQTALESNQNFRNSYLKLSKCRNDNKESLTEIAKSIGFDISDDGQKLLNVERRDIAKMINDPSKVILDSCISWNIAIAKEDNQYFLYEIAKKNSRFINMLYKFKRKYRDKNKHETELEIVSPKHYVDMLWDLLELGLGYKLNQGELTKLINLNNEIYDYSYSSEYIRTELGNKLFDSTNNKLAEFKLSLITMYDSYMTGQCSYIQEAYKLVDSAMTLLVNSIKDEFKLQYKDLDRMYIDTNQIVEYLKTLGFNTDGRIGNNIADSLNFVGQNDLIKKGFNSNFQNSVLRIKVLALVSMLIQEKNIKDCFNEYNDLFIATSTVSYIQRHQQIHSFDKKQASIVVEEIFKFMNYVVNQNSIINFR